MAFSEGYGIGSLKPGVCTSTTRPASPYVGQMIFETDTNRLAVYNGSSWIMLADADTPSGLELVKTQTIGTAVSSVTVGDVFSSTYDNYKIMISGGTASANLFLNMTLGSSTTQYYTAGLLMSWQTATLGAFNSDGGSTWLRAGYGESGSNLLMHMDIFAPNLTGYTYATAYISKQTGSMGFANFIHNIAAAQTSFTLTTSTGTLTGGTIRVYGYRNS